MRWWGNQEFVIKRLVFFSFIFLAHSLANRAPVNRISLIIRVIVPRMRQSLFREENKQSMLAKLNMGEEGQEANKGPEEEVVGRESREKELEKKYHCRP